MTVFPDYAKSDHKEVFKAFRAVKKQRVDFLTKAQEVSLKYTGRKTNAYVNGSEFGGMSFAGISAFSVNVDDLPGRWKTPAGNILTPFKNNPISEEFNFGYKAVNVPGRGNLIWGQGRMGTGVLFEHDGFIYSHIGFETRDLNPRDEEAMNEFGWTEILASEYRSAREAVIAKREEDQE